MTADVSFEIQHRFDTSPREVWDALVDWEGHAAWIPATRVELGEGDPTTPGFTFTAWTGVRLLALKDEMRVAECAWDAADQRGRCVVEKLGPVLLGRAGFTVAGEEGGTIVEWFENVTVRRAPRFLGSILTWFGSRGFRFGMRRLERQLGTESDGGSTP